MYRYIVNWILAFMIIQVLALYGRERRIKIQLPTRTTAVGQASMVTVQRWVTHLNCIFWIPVSVIYHLRKFPHFTHAFCVRFGAQFFSTNFVEFCAHFMPTVLRTFLRIYFHGHFWYIFPHNFTDVFANIFMQILLYTFSAHIFAYVLSAFLHIF